MIKESAKLPLLELINAGEATIRTLSDEPNKLRSNSRGSMVRGLEKIREQLEE